MIYGLVRFVRGILGFTSATSEKHTLRDELRRDAKLHQALGGDAHAQLGQLEREMLQAEQEQTKERVSDTEND